MQDTALNIDNLSKLKYDGEVSIAVASSRKSKKWKNKQLSWSTLLLNCQKLEEQGDRC